MFWKIFDGIRRIVVFLLGVLIILDSLRDSEAIIPELVIGMVMVGILPIENVVESWKPKRFRRHGADDNGQ
jgi:hypothetical protein